MVFCALTQVNRISESILTQTRGTGVLNRIFHSYAPYRGDVEGRRNGVLISTIQVSLLPMRF